ncbi:nuclease-related domain-containing protein [Curtobacterium sp. VKM Ac-1376]|uniref:nuclease-related domain-containing protein n=1 Tax=Curtobacterium sp. VKM Ac-1376 TaxID=123312 RepID=UPI00188C8A1D|nr:nuclease-related domain-containing protein [Curtobacterium sp. VKM Ac-1376]MBF4614127.1 NERD domain-containing protein [Curtobacterium sp. VKM Ac-1376]
MTSDLVPWSVAGGLAIVALVLVVLLRRHRTAARSDLDRAERARADEVARLDAEHREQTARLAAEQAQEIDAAEAARRDALAAAEQSRALARTGMKWEETSQRVILDACKAAGVNGALLTNVVFAPVALAERGPARSFVAQLDHVLVLDSGRVVVIENKRWNGIVFDGQRPSEVHRAFRNLLDESSLQPPFAVQVRSRRVLDHADEIEQWWQVRVQARGASPCSQVRQQARRLADFVASTAGVAREWVDTCVFYSGDAVAYVNPEDRSERGAPTAVVTSATELQGVISGYAQKSAVPNRARTDAVVRVLAGQGAHTTTIGSYRLPV